jgi:hypothetical protein
MEERSHTSISLTGLEDVTHEPKLSVGGGGGDATAHQNRWLLAPQRSIGSKIKEFLVDRIDTVGGSSVRLAVKHERITAMCAVMYSLRAVLSCGHTAIGGHVCLPSGGSSP